MDYKLINDGDLTLDSKQATINDGDLTIARTDGLQAALDSKQATINDGDLTIARTDGLQTALDSKQATINDGDLTIAKTNGLQAALDSKEGVSYTYSIEKLDKITYNITVADKTSLHPYQSLSNITCLTTSTSC